MDKDKKSLQIFLIKRFVITIILVGIAEIGVNIIQNNVFVPLLYRYYFDEIQGLKNLSANEITILFSITLVQLFLAALKSLFPAYFSHLLGEWSDWMGNATSHFVPDAPKNISMLDMPRLQALMLSLIIIVSLILTVAPYVIGIFIYSKTVVTEFKSIKEKDDEKTQEHFRKRNLLLSDIAHDLRTPMTTVGGYSKALLDGMINDEDKEKEYLEAIYRKSLKMNELIELLFEYVKMDSEGFSLDMEALDIVEVVRENIALNYADIEEAGFEIDVELPEEKWNVSADKVQISRVITNLLVNVMRHNPKSTKILVKMNRKLDEVRILIADTGNPIPEEFVDSLFDPFSKGDKSRSNSQGSGLGLSIAKKIVNMHDGDIILQTDIPEYTKGFEIRMRLIC